MENRIKQYRENKGLTQDQLAEIVSVSRQTIISLEKSKYTASLQLAWKLSAVFGVSIEELFIFKED